MQNSNAAITGTDRQSIFDLTAVPIGRFAHHEDLPAEEEARKVIELLSQLGARKTALSLPPTGPTLSAVMTLLHDWSEQAQPVNAMLYWVGHGKADRDGAWLAVSETVKDMKGSGFRPEWLVDHIENHWARRRTYDTWVLIVIEACGAARFVQLLAAELLKRSDPPKRLLLVGVGGTGQNYLGAFSNALRAALGSFTDNDTEIWLHDLMERVEGRLVDGIVMQHRLTPMPSFRRRQVISGGITATVDIYAELQNFLKDLPDDQRAHFVPKAQGSEQGELAWYFMGRVRQRREISDWLRTNATGLLVVTGRAGAGKSALLGNILVYANVRLRELLIQHQFIEDVAEEERPPDNVFDEVILLTGLTTEGLINTLLLRTFGRQPGATRSESLEQLISLLHDRKNQFTLLVDALDESQEPTSIAALVLQRIAAQPNCRVIVGTRRSTHEGPDQPDPVDQNLLDALRRGTDTSIVVADYEQAAIGKYVRRRLEAAKQKGELAVSVDVAEIADLIREQSSREFLYARLAIHEILAQPEIVQPEHRGRLEEMLAYDHRRLFAQAVRRLTVLNPINEALLEALALAQGRGLPRADRIWAIVAEGLNDHGNGAGALVTEDDIDGVLTSAAPYIMLDAEGGQSVYRLAHRTFQEYFTSIRSELSYG